MCYGLRFVAIIIFLPFLCDGLVGRRLNAHAFIWDALGVGGDKSRLREEVLKTCKLDVIVNK